VEVHIEPTVELPPLSARREKFLDALRRRFQALGLAADAALLERIVVLSLLSPLLLERPDAGAIQDDGRGALASGLSAQVEWLHVSRRFGYERGWSQRDGGVRQAHHSALAGGVFVGLLPDADSFQKVERLEQEGAGPLRRLGFGRVLAFDPFFAEHTPTLKEGQGHGH
jgi:hypothetical protein